MGIQDEDEVMVPAGKEGGDSSDDDIEIVPKSVDGFWLEDGDETPVSFATLPYSTSDKEAPAENVVYVRGTQDNGMRLYARATAWKLELTKDGKPAFHLKAEKHWIQLLKPRKSYEETIRSIVSAAYFLNYALVNPDASEKSLWSNIKDLFPSWEEAPNRNDLAFHLPIVQHLIASDQHLGAAAALQQIDTGMPKKRLASAAEAPCTGGSKGAYISDNDADGQNEPEQKRRKFEVDILNVGEEMDGYGDEDEDDVGDLSETVCCICDNGGSVICCDGPCMRSFHLNKGAGGAEDSHCSTLGFSKAEAERMEKFFCPNCKFKEHQCYACGKLGCSDDKAGAAQEVFVCDAAMCGHFYHPDCVAELILKDKDDSERSVLVESIKDGNGFVCPMHKCFKCGKGEVKEEQDLQFGVCRRCPRVWHRKCLPFPVPGDESEEEDDNDDPQRAWDDLLPNRILVYCERHPIITRLGTPARNHVKFPEGFMPSIKKVLVKKKTEKEEKRSKVIKVKKETDSLKGAFGEKGSRLSAFDGAKKKKLVGEAHSSAKYKLDHDASVPRGSSVDASAEGTILIKSRVKIGTTAKRDSSLSKERKEGVLKLERSNSLALKSPSSRESALRQLQPKTKLSVIKAVVVDDSTKDMVNELIERTKALVSMESILQKHDIPACYRRISKNPDKKYSLFKIESITKGMRKALETLESGGSIEDAKAKCSPDFIRFIELCRNDLRVYLSPFLHGARYTSFGRHFTKSEKLEEIVDRLHWFVEKGDMIVDFCCGANEFALFTRKKLEETGKKCEYKNFDLIQTKNEFNFEKRDWFQVRPDELPDGNRLIMGLNPPFGVKGHLANQFIDHALRFRPKLIILIVPRETERLDHKRDAYDLVWEDTDLLSGQSFYLPGSVDVDENPLNDWNVVAPPLSIWSRPDWTLRLREIALSKGHISFSSGSRFVGPLWKPPSRPTSPSSLMDFMVGQHEILPIPVLEEIEEEREDIYISPLTRHVEKQFVKQDPRPRIDRSSSARLKDESKRNTETSESKIKEKSSRAIDTSKKDTSSVIDIRRKDEGSNSAMDTPRKDSEPSESKSREKASRTKEIPRKDTSRSINTLTKNGGSDSATDTPRKDGSSAAKANTPSKPVVKDTSLLTINKSVIEDNAVPQRELERRGSNPRERKPLETPDISKERASESSVANQKNLKSEKKYDLFKKVSSEEQAKAQATENPSKPTPNSQQSPEKARRSLEVRTPVSKKNKKPNNRYNRGEGNWKHSSQDGNEWKRLNAQVDPSRSPNRRPNENHRHNGESDLSERGSPKRRHHVEADLSGRRSPNRYDKYEARRRSPDRYDRQSGGRHGEDRNESPERARLPSLANEQNRLSPEKADASSVVDLSTFFSNSDAKRDRARDFGDFGRRDYHASVPYRGISEESKRAWVDMESYQGGPESHLRASEYPNAGLAKTAFQDMAPSYGVSSSEVQIGSLGRHYTEPAVSGARIQDMYEVERSRLYSDPALSRHSKFYQSELPREMLSIDRFGGQLITESSYRGSASTTLAERNVLPPWPASRPASNVYSSYASQLQPQASLGDPSRLSAHGLLDNRLAQTPNVQQYYPQSQGRYAGHPNQQFTGGWYDD